MAQYVTVSTERNTGTYMVCEVFRSTTHGVSFLIPKSVLTQLLAEADELLKLFFFVIRFISAFLSAPRPAATMSHWFNKLKKHLLGDRNEMGQNKGFRRSAAASCMHCSKESPLI